MSVKLEESVARMMALLVNIRRNGKEPVSPEEFMLHKDEETEMASMDDMMRALKSARVK